MSTLNATSPTGDVRLSRYHEQLSDPGVASTASSSSAATAPQRPSRQSSLMSMQSIEDPPVPFITAFGDLRPSRASVVSMQEFEHGWGSNIGNLNSAKMAAKEARLNAPQARQPYRPPFAPSVSDTDLEAVLPVVNSHTAPNDKLSRGKSLKEKIAGAMRKEKGSPEASPKHVTLPVTPEADEKEDKMLNGYTVAPIHDMSGSPKEKSNFVDGVVRRLSRRTTKKPPRQFDPGYTLPSQAEIDNIPLYAAPPEAKVENAPMLSSYAPRPALRPRAATEGSVGANLKPTPSITVGQARLAYARSLRQQKKKEENAAPVPAIEKTYSKDDLATLNRRSRNSSNASSTAATAEDLLSITPRKPPRRSRQVPAGWATAEAFGSTKEADETEKKE